MSENTQAKFEALANSALLRVVFYVSTTVMMPGIGLGVMTVLNNLQDINTAIAATATTQATTELRLSSVERSNVDRDLALRLLTETSMRHDFEVKRLLDESRRRNHLEDK